MISVIGFYFISLTGGFEALNKGDLLLLIGAGTCVVFVYLMEYFAKRAEACMFTCLQFFFTGLFCIPGALIFADCTLEMMKDAIRCARVVFFSKKLLTALNIFDKTYLYQI